MFFKSERRNEKKGNRMYAPQGSNSAQHKRAEVNQQYLGTRTLLALGKINRGRKIGHG